MKNKHNHGIQFVVDSSLVENKRGEIILQAFQDSGISFENEVSDHKINIIFTNYPHPKKFNKIKSKILIYPKGAKDSVSNHYVANFEDPNELSLLIKLIIFADQKSFLNFKLKDSELTLDFIKKKNLSADKNIVRSFSNEISLITDLEIILLREDDIEKWNVLIDVFLKKNHWPITIKVLKGKDIFEEILDPDITVFQLPIGQYFLIIQDKSESEVEKEFRLELLVLVMMRVVQNVDYQEKKDIGEIIFWKNIFSKIPYPMAVVSELGELIIYNEYYTQTGILPRNCLLYKDQDYIEVEKHYYKVRRFDFCFQGVNIHYFIFYSSEKIVDNSNNELGIVSSSIAHELNNPLAGILAALSLLRLENNWSEEAIIEIEEMRNGARRCKELVEIFLGFSRLSPKDINARSLKISLDQAINLLHFRMVESGLRIEMKLSPESEELSFDVNSSVLSMIIYLILSELMTAFAHHRLLLSKGGATLEGNIVGQSQQIQFFIHEEFGYEKDILNSRLLRHLLFFEKMEIVFFKKEIRLLKNDI